MRPSRRAAAAPRLGPEVCWRSAGGETLPWYLPCALTPSELIPGLASCLYVCYRRAEMMVPEAHPPGQPHPSGERPMPTARGMRPLFYPNWPLNRLLPRPRLKLTISTLSLALVPSGRKQSPPTRILRARCAGQMHERGFHAFVIAD